MSEIFASPYRGATHVEVLPEEGYDGAMTETVEPLLEACRRQGYLAIVRGMRLNYEYYLCADPVGAVVLCHGFTESAEKFREMAYYFLQAGYSVFAPDHRGHGLSYRDLEDTSMTHINKFQDYVNDFDLFINKIVRPNTVNLPLYLYAHSMGGAVGAMYLSQHPVTFRRAVLNAPMIAPKTDAFPLWLARWMAAGFCLVGKGKDRVFKYGDFDQNEPFEEAASSSFARFEYYRQKRVRYRHLRNTSATYSWLYQATKVPCWLLNRANCATVQAPVLLFQAENDAFVRPRAQEKYIARIPHGEILCVKEAKHEIYLSPNEILQPYVDKVLDFYAK